MCCSMQILTQFDGKTNLWKSSSLEAVFDEINFSLTQPKWQRLAELSLALRFESFSNHVLPLVINSNVYDTGNRDCFAREVPVSQAVTIQGQDLRANMFVLSLIFFAQ